MEIKMDAEAWGAIASAAIWEQMSQESRDACIQQAIQSLLTKDNAMHSPTRGKTPLQVAFERAISEAARKAVEEKIANDPEIAAHIHQLLGPIVNGALEAEAEQYNYSLSTAIGIAVGNWIAEQARKEH